MDGEGLRQMGGRWWRKRRRVADKMINGLPLCMSQMFYSKGSKVKTTVAINDPHSHKLLLQCLMGVWGLISP